VAPFAQLLPIENFACGSDYFRAVTSLLSLKSKLTSLQTGVRGRRNPKMKSNTAILAWNEAVSSGSFVLVLRNSQMVTAIFTWH
jgi:hypothetical protein